MIRAMRLRLPTLLLATALGLLLAGCAEDLKETGISRSTAVGIAERNCPQYPDTYSYVDRSEWNPDGHFWLVAITDRDGAHGRVFKISRGGKIVDSHKIDRPDDYYDGPRHLGYGYGYYW
jgi:hypothetical protein